MIREKKAAGLLLLTEDDLPEGGELLAGRPGTVAIDRQRGAASAVAVLLLDGRSPRSAGPRTTPPSGVSSRVARSARPIGRRSCRGRRRRRPRRRSQCQETRHLPADARRRPHRRHPGRQARRRHRRRGGPVPLRRARRPVKRWGDYSGVSVDPAAGTFWTVSQYSPAIDIPVAGDERDPYYTRVAKVAFDGDGDG